MPTVPMRRQDRLAATPLPTLRQNPNAPIQAFDGAVDTSVDLSGPQKLLAGLTQEYRQHADEVALLAADNQLNDVQTQAELAGKALKGKDALGATAQARTMWEEQTAKIRGELTEAQQRSFDKRASQSWQQLHGSLEVHAAHEHERFDETESQVWLAKNREKAASNFTVPAVRDHAITEIGHVAEMRAKRMGLSPEGQQLAGEEERSKAHMLIMSRMLTAAEKDGGGDLVAARYFATVKDTLTAKDRIAADEHMKSASTDGEAVRAVDTVWSKQGPKSANEPVKMFDMEQSIRDKYVDQPLVAKAAIAELRSRAGAFNSQQTELKSSHIATVYAAVNEGAGLSAIVKMPEWRALAGDEKVKITRDLTDRSYTLGQRNKAAREEKNWGAYWQYSSPDALSKMSEKEILAKQGELGWTLVNQLMNQRRQLDTPAKVAAAAIDTEQFNTLASDAGFPAFKKQNDQSKAVLGRLKNAVETAIDAEQQARGRVLSRDEKATVMHKIVDQKVMIDRFGLTDTEKPAAGLTLGEEQKSYIPIEKVPQSFVTRSLNIARSAGMIHPDATDAKATEGLQRRLERAYAARRRGESDTQIIAIITGKQ